MEKPHDLFSLSEFIVILIRNKVLFIFAWVCVMVLAVTYQVMCKKTYRLEGSIYVGRFQEILIEEGEFVAKRLTDYSYVKRALDQKGVVLDFPVQQLLKGIKTEVVNEVKKTQDVGIIELSVDCKDPKLTHAIYKALTDQLIEDHKLLLKQSVDVFESMIANFKHSESELAIDLKKDEAYALAAEQQPNARDSVPSHLLLRHTVGEKTQFLKKLIQDRHYLEIESNSATKSYNTKLSAEPQIPDDYLSPRPMTTLLVGLFAATVLATIAVLLWNLYTQEVKSRLKESAES